MSPRPRTRRPPQGWKALALEAYRRGDGLASTAVRLGVDLRRVLFYLVDTHKASELREQYPDYFDRAGQKDASRSNLNAAHKRDRDRPRTRGASAAIVGTDGRLYGDE